MTKATKGWLAALALWCAAHWAIAVAANDPKSGVYHSVMSDGRDVFLEIELVNTNITVEVQAEGEIYLSSLWGLLAQDKSFRLARGRDEHLRRKALVVDGRWDSSGALLGSIFIGNSTNGISFVAQRIAATRNFQRKSGLTLFGRGGRAEASADWPEFIGTNQLHRAVSAMLATAARTNVNAIAAKGPGLTVEGLKDNTFTSKHEAFFSMDVAWMSSNWISLHGAWWEDTGGAHGNGVPVSRNFVLQNGKVKEVRLADLFQPDKTWMKRLSSLGIAALRAQRAPWVTSGQLNELTNDELRTWTADRLGLRFYFGPYVAGPYSDGDWEIFIPWADVRGLLDPGGPARLIPGALSDVPLREATATP